MTDATTNTDALGDEIAAPTIEPRADGISRKRGLLNAQLTRFGGIYLLALIIAVFAVWVPDTFLTGDTARAIAGDQAVTVILALGLLFTLASGSYDLSIAQNLGLSAVVSSSLMTHSHQSPWLAVLVTLALGAGIGLVNGLLVAVVGVNSFIATLGMSSVLLAITEIVSHQQFIGPVPPGLQRLTTGEVGGVPVLMIYALVIAIVAWYVLEHSPVGRRLQATGANPDATRLAGVRTGRYVCSALVASGIIGSLAGILVAAKVGTVSPDVGPPYLLPAFAACFLGTTQFKLGRFNVWGTVLALYLLATGVKGLQLAGGQLWVTDLFNGVALIGAVSVAVVSERRRTRGAV